MNLLEKITARGAMLLLGAILLGGLVEALTTTEAAAADTSLPLRRHVGAWETPTATLVPPTGTPTATPAWPYGAAQHIFIIVMENKGYRQVWGTRSSRYITRLGETYARATNYHAIQHPSLPNYLQMYAGSAYGISRDCSPSATCHSSAITLADNLEAAGFAWKGYMQSMPAPCYLKTSGGYAPKHNPFVYFDDIRLHPARCRSHVVSYTALATDMLAAETTPNYAFITPNLCNDMHDCSVKTGNLWLKNSLPPILNSPACTVDRCLLVLTWDEDDGSSSNRVLTIFAGSAAKTGGVVSSAAYGHYSLLHTIEMIFGLPTQTANDAGAAPMLDLLR